MATVNGSGRACSVSAEPSGHPQDDRPEDWHDDCQHEQSDDCDEKAQPECSPGRVGLEVAHRSPVEWVEVRDAPDQEDEPDQERQNDQERRQESDSVLAGIRALGQRLKI